jgi:hypothetical protein
MTPPDNHSVTPSCTPDERLGQVDRGAEVARASRLEAAIVTGDRVAELTWPLLLAYMHSAEAATRWEQINADGSRVVIVLRPASVTGRQQVR